MTRSARNEILARIGNALAGKQSAPQVPRDYQRTGEHAAGAAELLELLAERLADYKAAVHHASAQTLKSTLDTVLAGVGTVVVPPGLPQEWVPENALVDDGSLAYTELDQVGAVLTACTAAAAATGTIVLDGSPDQGRRALTLIPDRHICVVRAAQVVHTVPELLARVDPQRPLTFISGPSATSDIELQRVEGVHGPRTLIVVLLS